MFWKTIDFVENLEMTQIAGCGVCVCVGGGGGHVVRVIITQCVRKSMCDLSLIYPSAYISAVRILLLVHL